MLLRTAKLVSAYGLVRQSSEFFSSNYFQIAQHVVLSHGYKNMQICDVLVDVAVVVAKAHN